MTKEKEVDLGGLIAGYLDVKLPARARRRRFGHWKSWRRHWVEARLATAESPDSSAGVVECVELVLSPARFSPETGVIRVPARAGASAAASVCRTASRSRGHAFVVATPGSEAELGGDVLFLAARSEADTERWMAVLRAAISSRAPPAATPTPRSGCSGALLSPASAALLRGRRLSRSEGDLLGAPTTPADHGLGLLSPPGPCLRVPTGLGAAGEARRGDSVASATSTLGRSPLRQPRQPFRLLYGRRRADTLRADTLRADATPCACACSCPCADRLSTSPQATSGSALSLLGGKIASGLLSAGLGLILSTPGGSEAEDNDLDADDVDEDADVSAELPDVMAAALALDRRRESAVSVASGIYEEILETAAGTPTVVIDRVYENAAVLGRRASNGLEGHYEDPALLFSPKDTRALHQDLAGVVSPPPLPPRQNLTPISELLTRTNGAMEAAAALSGLRCASGTEVDGNGYVQMGLMRTKHATKCHKARVPISSAWQGHSVQGGADHLGADTEPTYLPMSPIKPLLNGCRDGER